MMHFTHLALTVLALASAALASPIPLVPGSTIEALTQALYRFASLIDSKDWSAFDTIMTQNVTFDATDLLPAKGGIARGFDEVVGAFQHDAANGARTSHVVTNVLVLEVHGQGQAKVSSYVTYSHWIEDALDDITQTYRIWYRSDDVWVLQDGAWKVEYFKIYDMGYGIEAIYYGSRYD